MRAGAFALSLLAEPLDVQVLTALSTGPQPLIKLRQAVGSPAQTTARSHLNSLLSIGVLTRERQNEFPGNVDFALTASGRELLGVAALLDRWLAAAPRDARDLGTPAAKNLLKALVDGWSTGILRILAVRSLSLTELNSVLPAVSYPSLERRLSAMRMLGLVERCLGGERGRPYVVTDWLRRAVAPIVAGARWERQYAPRLAPPITNRDIEAAFLLTLPLLGPPPALSGSCQLSVQMKRADPSVVAGVKASVSRGTVVSCSTQVGGRVDAWAVGDIAPWFSALLEGDLSSLEIGGDSALAVDLIEGVHGLLSSSPEPASVRA